MPRKKKETNSANKLLTEQKPQTVKMEKSEIVPANIAYVGITGDFIHPGIVNIISVAARQAPVTVGLLTDKAIANHKRLPYLNYEQRKKTIESIKGVAEVIPQETWSYVSNIQKLHPRYFVHGDDWKGTQIRTDVIKTLSEYGGILIEIPYTKGISSSELNKSITSVGTTPDIRRSMLKRLIASKDVLRVMECHSGLCGLIIENAEWKDETTGMLRTYDAMWCSSLTDSTVKGKPDIEAVDLTTRMNELTNILECTTKPIIYDADTGGKNEHFAFTVRTLERNGVSACIIEDKCGLKQNSLFGTAAKQEQLPISDFCDKIRAGKMAQVSEDFMIFARCESLIAGKGIEDALERCFAYVEAGADGIMIHSKERDGKEVFDFMHEFRKKFPSVPIVVVPTTYNTFTATELHNHGATIVIHANHMLRAAYPAMKKVAETILENDNSYCVNDMCMPIKEILNLIPGTAATVKQ